MDNNQDQSRETHFGFRSVPEDDKASLVRGVFDRVASRYDIMNDVMSAGAHRVWKDAMVTWADPRPGYEALDVAGGTGDIAFRIADRIARTGGCGGRVVVADINHDMLREGRARAGRRAEDGRPVPQGWICGDAMALPFSARAFDLYTIAFGIRNVTRIGEALREAHRVLKTGGRFVCLEFSKPDEPLLERIYDYYSFNMIPRLGGLIAGDAEPYQYLVESIRRFPDQAGFAGMIEEAGFSNVKVRNLAGGIAALHSGWKI